MMEIQEDVIAFRRQTSILYWVRPLFHQNTSTSLCGSRESSTLGYLVYVLSWPIQLQFVAKFIVYMMSTIVGLQCLLKDYAGYVIEGTGVWYSTPREDQYHWMISSQAAREDIHLKM